MKSKIIFTTIIAAALATGCDKFLDVHPKGEKINMFETAEEYEDALYGVYSELTGSNLYGQHLIILPEVMSQNFTTSDYKYAELAEGEMTSSGSTSRLYLGEALALRAFVHYEVLKLFGPPYWASDTEKKTTIPYVTKYSFDISPLLSYDEVCRNILEDLKRAEEYLDEDETLVPAERSNTALAFTDARIAHINLYAVQALMARVYWSMNDMDNAEVYAQKVISSGKFSFRPTSAFVQPDNGTFDLNETIFGLYINDESAMMKKLNINGSGASSSLVLSSGYASIYEKDSGAATDYRLSAWFDVSSSLCRRLVNNCFISGENTYSGKSILGYDVVRLPEMYYIVAEANIDKDPAKAVKYFDEVLKSRGRETFEESGTALTRDLLFEERHREFYCEGLTWMGMKKEKKDITTVSGKTLHGDLASTYTLTVPDEELEARKNINN